MIPASTDYNIKEPFRTILIDLPWLKNDLILAPTHTDKMPKYVLGINPRTNSNDNLYEYVIYMVEKSNSCYELYRFEDYNIAVKQLQILHNIYNPYDMNQGLKIYFALLEFFQNDTSLHDLIMGIIIITSKDRLKDIEISNMNTLAYEYNMNNKFYENTKDIDEMFMKEMHVKYYDGKIYELYSKILDLFYTNGFYYHTWECFKNKGAYDINLSAIITSILKTIASVFGEEY